MKSAVEQLVAYKSVHLNPVNIKTHFIGVPMIVWAAFLFLSQIRLYDSGIFVVNGAMVSALCVLIYYFLLHRSIALGLTLVILPVLYSTELAVHQPGAFWYGLAVFVTGWLFQLIGHKFERAKPAFVDDLNQLLIGPFFLMAEVYFWLGWERPLRLQITPLAVSKRRALEAERRAK